MKNEPRLRTTFLSGLTAAAAAAIGVTFAAPAHGAITVQASAGTSFMLARSADISSDRGPVTFDIGPGWDLGLVRLEIPMIFALDSPDAYPRARSTFLGLRPQAKVYPFDWLYGKLSAPVMFPGREADDDPAMVLGLTVGGGIELGLGDILLVHAELNMSPYVSPSTALPLEGRLGATFKF